MSKTRQNVLETLTIIAGAAIVGIGVYFFKFPNNFCTGGVSGISVILSHYYPKLSAGTFVTVLNMLLLLLGFAVVGKSFGIKTVLGSIVFSVVTWGLERIAPMSAPFTDQPLLELIFAVTLPAIGSAILFNRQASTGGTDIVAMILKKHSSIDIGKCLLCVDFIIAAATCFVFDMKTGLYSILGLALKSLIVDMALENIKVSKCFQIVTDKPDEITDFILHTLGRSATCMKAEGAFTHENKTVLLTVMNRSQAVQMRKFAHEVDPHCFIMITNSSEIIGKGFRGLL